jgi:threonine/homoserine/homoserine lactone efflux protein
MRRLCLKNGKPERRFVAVDAAPGATGLRTILAMDPALKLFAQSMLIGLSIAAPVGQIGVLAIQRTLQHGRGAGLATGLGAALADAVYGAIGAFGITVLIAWLVEQKALFGLVGAAVLLGLAWRTWRQPVRRGGAPADTPRDWLRYVAGTFVLTLSNPSTILSFLAVFGAIAGVAPQASPWLMVGGVLLGSALWWVVLSAAVDRLRSRFDERWQRGVNTVSALLLAGFAVWQLAQLARGAA